MNTNFEVNIMTEKLSFKEKIGYTLVAMGSDFTTQFTGSFLLYFYTNVAGIKAGLASTIISLSVIWDAINDPLIASYIDNHRFKNGERIRPLLLFSSFPFAICLVLLFTTLPNASYTAKILYSFGWYFIYMVPRTFYYLPIFTMRQIATPDTTERVKLNQFISYGQAVGSALPTLVMWPVIRAVAGLQADGKTMVNPTKGFFVGALVVGIMVIICSLYNYFTTKERVFPENTEKTTIADAFKILLKYKNFIRNLILFFFYGTCVTLCTGYAVYYCTYVIDNAALLTPMSAMFIVGTILATPFVKGIHAKFGRNKTLIIGCAVLAAGSLMFVIAPRFILSPFFFAFCVGVGTAITIILIGINRADVTDVVEFKSGKRMDGMVSNVTSFIKKCCSALLTLVLGWTLQFAGYDGNLSVQPASAVTAIVLIMGVGVLISAVMMVVMSTKLTLDEDVSEMIAGRN